MLAASARLRNRDDFARTVSRGRRATRGSLAVHVAVPSREWAGSSVGDAITGSPETGKTSWPSRSEYSERATNGSGQKSPASGDVWLSPRAGFVVSRAVGGAVARNRVRRRLRHLMRDRLVSLPAGTDVVVRALPGAATRSSAALGVDLDRALVAALDRSDMAGAGGRGSK